MMSAIVIQAIAASTGGPLRWVSLITGSAIAADFGAFVGREARGEVVPVDDEEGHALAGDDHNQLHADGGFC